MPAPLQGPFQSPVHRFVLGAFEVTTIVDGGLQMPIKGPFLLDKDADDIAAIAQAAYLPAETTENTFVPTIVNTGRELVLFDTGFGELRRGNGAGYLRERLGLAGYTPEDIDIVAFTHMHPDHIGGILEGGAPAFPNARLMIGRREFDEWNSGASIPPQRSDNRELFLKLIAPLADQFTYLDDGDAVCTGITAEAAFGHSPGHMMYRLTSGDQSALVWGDVANHFVFSVEHPFSPVGFDDDKETAIATRIRVLEMVAAEGLVVVGHHMPFPSVGYVEQSAHGYRWIPMSYQMEP